MNCFRQHSPGKTLDVQVFHENLSKLLDRHARQFVVMVITLVEDVLVDLMQGHNCLATAF